MVIIDPYRGGNDSGYIGEDGNIHKFTEEELLQFNQK